MFLASTNLRVAKASFWGEKKKLKKKKKKLPQNLILKFKDNNTKPYSKVKDNKYNSFRKKKKKINPSKTYFNTYIVKLKQRFPKKNYFVSCSPIASNTSCFYPSVFSCPRQSVGITDSSCIKNFADIVTFVFFFGIIILKNEKISLTR